MGQRGLFQALNKIAAQPDKDFGELVRLRWRKRGLPVAPMGKVLPFLPAWNNGHPVEGAVLDAAAETVLDSDTPTDELRMAHLRLAERRLAAASGGAVATGGSRSTERPCGNCGRVGSNLRARAHGLRALVGSCGGEFSGVSACRQFCSTLLD